MGIDPVTHAPRLDLLQLSSILSSPLYDYARHLNLPDSIGAMGSTTPNQNRVVLDLAKQLTVISQNSDQGTPLSSLESVSANTLQSQYQIQEQNISPNPNYVGGQCHPLPLSSWDVSHGGFGPHDLNSSVAEDPVHIGYSTDQYLDSFQFQSSLAGPANAFRYSTAEEVLQKPGESPALSSLTSNSGCTFNSSPSARMRCGTSGAGNIEDERKTAHRISRGLLYDNIIDVSWFNSTM